MPRRARRRAEDVRPVGIGGLVTSDGEWSVRPTRGEKTYRCPGCDQPIAPGVPHVVAWRADDPDDRRHWHSPCWAARHRRGVKVHRSKNAPRHG